MRVTDKMIYDTIRKSFSQSTERLMKIQRSISSGKRVNEPADDPLAMTQILDYRSSLASVDQYSENIDQGTSWLKLTESSLYDINQLLARTKELVLSQTTGTATDETRQATAEEVVQTFERAIQLANTQLRHRHIFAGFKSNVAPFLSTADYTYQGDDGTIQIEIARNQKATINLNGSEVFTGGPVNVFETLDNVVTDLRNNDISALQSDIGALDDSINHILGKLAEVAAKTNQLESTKENLRDLKLHMTERLSDLEDTDFAEAVAELSLQETIYQASLASSARIIQTSLLDFLR